MYPAIRDKRGKGFMRDLTWKTRKEKEMREREAGVTLIERMVVLGMIWGVAARREKKR